MKGVMRYRKKRKISLMYIGPYRISNKIGQVVYRLELPQRVIFRQPVFHVSMLKQFIGGSSLIDPSESIKIDKGLTY